MPINPSIVLEFRLLSIIHKDFGEKVFISFISRWRSPLPWIITVRPTQPFPWQPQCMTKHLNILDSQTLITIRRTDHLSVHQVFSSGGLFVRGLKKLPTHLVVVVFLDHPAVSRESCQEVCNRRRDNRINQSKPPIPIRELPFPPSASTTVKKRLQLHSSCFLVS